MSPRVREYSTCEAASSTTLRRMQAWAMRRGYAWGNRPASRGLAFDVLVGLCRQQSRTGACCARRFLRELYGRLGHEVPPENRGHQDT
jgi:hypothetical protein